MTRSAPLAVVDCVVFLQALLSDRGPAGALLRHAEDGGVIILITPVILDELAKTLGKPRLRAKNPQLTDGVVTQYLERIRSVGIVFEPVPRIFRYERDVDDEPYVNLAIAAGADYLVSRDKDLLDLMDESTPEGKDFRGRFPELRIIEPVAFLRALADAER